MKFLRRTTVRQKVFIRKYSFVENEPGNLGAINGWTPKYLVKFTTRIDEFINKADTIFISIHYDAQLNQAVVVYRKKEKA